MNKYRRGHVSCSIFVSDVKLSANKTDARFLYSRIVQFLEKQHMLNFVKGLLKVTVEVMQAGFVLKIVIEVDFVYIFNAVAEFGSFSAEKVLHWGQMILSNKSYQRSIFLVVLRLQLMGRQSDEDWGLHR